MIKISDLRKKLDIGQVVRVSDANGLTLVLKGTKKGTSYRFEHRCTFNGNRICYTIPTEDLQQARFWVSFWICFL